MTRRVARVLLAVAVGFLITGCRPRPAERPAPRPNILFVLLDDLRWDTLGYAGHPHVRTPQIDRIANEGVNFKNAFCTTSLCSPSRASLLSGVYAHTHGVTNNFTEIPGRLETFPKALQQAGYATAYVGKYHMGEANDEPRPGFDYFVTHKGQGKYFDTEFNLNGQRRDILKGYYTTVVTDLALEWLKRDHAGKPWLLMVGHKAPHSFYTPEPKFEHVFDDVRVSYPASAFALGDKPRWITERLDTWHGIYGPLFDWRKKFPDRSPSAVKDFENMVHAYWGTILSVDESVGRLRQWLEESGQLDNTIIVFVGDNGLLEGEHGMVDKRTMHEPSIRIPMAVRYPGLTTVPRVVDAQVLTVDMAPSLLELAGAPPLSGVHGRSWVQLVQAGDPAWRKSWFYYYNYEKEFPYTPNVRAKLEHYTGERPLFDLFGVEEEIERALARRVDLKSGGYLIIDQTEALTTVDVNTGGFVSGRSFDDTIFKTNLEAAQAIARQLRLRNLGGIIIVDFIDMESVEHRDAVLAEFRKALSRDRTRVTVNGFSQLGLVEMTRKRTRESLAHVLCEPCPVCAGRGELKTAQTICYDVLREILRADRQFNAKEYRILASQKVIDLFLDEESVSLTQLGDFIGKPISMQVETAYMQEQYDVILV